MDRRVFLGWDGPLLERVVDWLWERGDSMTGMLVVVPTAQSGRRLREALAERGPCLAPRVVTPGWFLRTPGAAPETAELVAWVEALEGVEDWSEFSEVFPKPPGVGEGPGWSLALARSLGDLERGLQEAAITPIEAARRLADSPDSGRWSAVADLWRRKESALREWGLAGRGVELGRAAADPISGSLVLAGVPDLPAAAVERLGHASELTVLVAAPPEEASGFDEWGRPTDEWNRRAIDWPSNGEVELCADPRQQAARALEQVAAAGTRSDGLALASADEETGEELVRAFARGGWIVHNPAVGGHSRSRGWWSAWRAFVATPDLASAIDLLGFAETARLSGGSRAQRVRAISKLRDSWQVRDREDLERLVALETRDPEGLELATETMLRLERWRSRFLREPFARAVGSILERVDPEEHRIRDWLDGMEGLLARVRRDSGFWLDVMIGSFADTEGSVPDGRVADLHGWLELLHAPGRHLVLCGMNEGRVPGGVSSDTWLPEGVRERLGLATDATRAARDAYLLRALVEARMGDGRVDLLLAKSSGDGDALLPSRLLLAAEGSELARRVGILFADIEPPDAGLGWQADWRWQVPSVEARSRLSVTSLRDFLACPMRFHLKYGLGMRAPEPERLEWNARDFGNVAHAVLERWGLDEEARDFSKVAELEDWLHAELDREIRERFGNRPPLAVRIQSEGLRQRLSWFAAKQACERASGWRVEDVEKKFEIDVGGVTLVGKIDRIDVDEDGRRRVLDYKTFAKFAKVEQKHRVQLRTDTVIPAHLEGVDEVIVVNAKGKGMLWRDLQVPLYAEAIEGAGELGYFVLGATEAATGLSLWDGFREEDLRSARDCAAWVIGQIRAGVREPAAEKVKYDDLEALAVGRKLGEMVEFCEE